MGKLLEAIKTSMIYSVILTVLLNVTNRLRDRLIDSSIMLRFALTSCSKSYILLLPNRSGKSRFLSFR